jgi:hypothetical protein
VTEDHANSQNLPSEPPRWVGGPAESRPDSKHAPVKLDHHVTCTKHATSHFLIDNFERLPREGVHPERSRRVTPLQKRFAAKPGPASSIQPRASRISNRQSPELESRLSHRKQRTENFLIAKFRPILPSAVPAALGAGSSLRPSPNFRLSTLNSRLLSLIGNEMHSRAESSGCKQRTSHFLIGNEFHFIKAGRFATFMLRRLSTTLPLYLPNGPPRAEFWRSFDMAATAHGRWLPACDTFWGPTHGPGVEGDDDEDIEGQAKDDVEQGHEENGNVKDESLKENL